jgi:hypothetical protein
MEEQAITILQIVQMFYIFNFELNILLNYLHIDVFIPRTVYIDQILYHTMPPSGIYGNLSNISMMFKQ